MSKALDALPPIAVDVDGVVCAPPFGLNFGISAGAWAPHRVDRMRAAGERRLVEQIARLRYGGRRPRPGIVEGMRSLAEHRRIVLVTGRPGLLRTSLLSWLQKHQIKDYVSEVYLNDTGQHIARYKVETALKIGASEFIEDDGRTVRFLAENGMLRVFLVDWPANRSDYPGHVTVVSSLADVGRLLASEPRAEQT